LSFLLSLKVEQTQGSTYPDEDDVEEEEEAVETLS
jgi:hypothetical protein